MTNKKGYVGEVQPVNLVAWRLSMPGTSVLRYRGFNVGNNSKALREIPRRSSVDHNSHVELAPLKQEDPDHRLKPMLHRCF